jgi:hypothetical protein
VRKVRKEGQKGGRKACWEGRHVRKEGMLGREGGGKGERTTGMYGREGGIYLTSFADPSACRETSSDSTHPGILSVDAGSFAQ